MATDDNGNIDDSKMDTDVTSADVEESKEELVEEIKEEIKEEVRVSEPEETEMDADVTYAAAEESKEKIKEEIKEETRISESEEIEVKKERKRKVRAQDDNEGCRRRMSERPNINRHISYDIDPLKHVYLGKKPQSSSSFKKKKPKKIVEKPSSSSDICINKDADNDATKPRWFARHMVPDENGVLRHVESVMCHQCQRNDKGCVVRCQKCNTKRYCVPCMNTWYPNMTEEMFAECCPVCLDNCNCKRCLRDVHPKVKSKIEFEPTADQKVQYSIYTLHVLLPFLKRLNEDHIKEKMIESKIQGCTLSDVKLQEAGSNDEERIMPF